jgi:hypothetical protein
MRPIFVGAVVSGLLIAVVFLIFQARGEGEADEGVAGSSEVSFEAPLELVPENPDPDNPGSNFTGSGPFEGISPGGVDPLFLIAQLEVAGVEIPEGASTEDLM